MNIIYLYIFKEMLVMLGNKGNLKNFKIHDG